MGELQELQLQIKDNTNDTVFTATETTINNIYTKQKTKTTNLKRLILIALYTFLVLAGQGTATLLGNLYYDKGGKSKWMATLVQLAGFPILLPYYFIPIRKSEIDNNNKPSLSSLTFVYTFLGILVAADCYLYSVGLQYLPVSTYSLICASQLAFNAFFSFFLNSQKFTPYIINSLILLTISSTLLVFQKDDSDKKSNVSKTKYAVGFICTVAASAGYGLVLSLTQLAFKKVIKSESFRAIMDMIVYVNMVASFVTVIGLFGSGEWKHLSKEMEMFEIGRVAYVMNLVWTAVAWVVFSIGCVGLIFEASSLFSNAISVLGLPVVPVFAVVFFHDSMDGVKVIAMVLGIWGFVSFMYQQYLDDYKLKVDVVNGDDDGL